MRLEANLQYFEDIKTKYQTDSQIKIAYAWRKYAVSEILFEKERNADKSFVYSRIFRNRRTTMQSGSSDRLTKAKFKNLKEVPPIYKPSGESVSKQFWA